MQNPKISLILVAGCLFFITTGFAQQTPTTNTADKPDTLKQKQDTLSQILPKPKYVLPEVVVTATRTPIVEKVAPASVSVLAPEELIPAQNVATALSQTQGVSLGRYGGLGSETSLLLRGASMESVLYLLDGIPLNSAQNGSFDLNKLSSNFQKIEVVRGPASHLYGANAVAGVVNIITDNPPTEKAYSKVTFEKGNYGNQFVQGELEKNLTKYAHFSILGSWNKTDGQRVNSDYDGSNYSLKLLIEPISDWQVRIRYQEYKSENGVPGSTAYQTPADRQKDRQQDVQFKLSYKEDVYWITASQSLIETRFYDALFNTTTRHFTRQSAGECQISLPLLPSGKTVFGGSYQPIKGESDVTNNHNLHQVAGFLNQQYQPIEKLLVVVGAHYGHHSIYRDQISPSISASYEARPTLSVYASCGKAFRAPTINDLYWKDDLWMMYGNPDLRPETSIQIEGGWKMENPSLKSSLSLFQRKTKNMINWQEQPDFSWKVMNIDKAKAQGVELMMDYKILACLTVSGNYTYCKVKEDSANGRLLPYRPLNVANFSLAINDYQITKGLQLGWKFQTQYTDMQVVSYPSIWGTGKTLPRYIVSNQTLSLKIRDARLYWKVENLFNAAYQTRDSYPMPRRSYAFGISWEFWD
ncbi:MAG: TonB-dependent receptor [Candidatus Edwardsbacteria bacterium]